MRRARAIQTQEHGRPILLDASHLNRTVDGGIRFLSRYGELMNIATIGESGNNSPSWKHSVADVHQVDR